VLTEEIVSYCFILSGETHREGCNLTAKLTGLFSSPAFIEYRSKAFNVLSYTNTYIAWDTDAVAYCFLA
jgi:hypothetical protein